MILLAVNIKYQENPLTLHIPTHVHVYAVALYSSCSMSRCDGIKVFMHEG
jgi:hypothetical protein